MSYKERFIQIGIITLWGYLKQNWVCTQYMQAPPNTMRMCSKQRCDTMDTTPSQYAGPLHVQTLGWMGKYPHYPLRENFFTLESLAFAFFTFRVSVSGSCSDFCSCSLSSGKMYPSRLIFAFCSGVKFNGTLASP